MRLNKDVISVPPLGRWVGSRHVMIWGTEIISVDPNLACSRRMQPGFEENLQLGSFSFHPFQKKSIPFYPSVVCNVMKTLKYGANKNTAAKN